MGDEHNRDLSGAQHTVHLSFEHGVFYVCTCMKVSMWVLVESLVPSLCVHLYLCKGGTIGKAWN